MTEEPAKRTPRAACTVCRGSGVCSYCNGDGYAIEHERLTPCGVCETTGICSVCKATD